MTDQISVLLAELALKSSLFLIIALAVTSLARRLSSEERHTVWVFALVGLLVLPVASIVGPTVKLPMQEIMATARSVADSANAEPGTATGSTRSKTTSSAMAVAKSDSTVPGPLDDRAGGPLAATGWLWPIDAAVLVTAVYGCIALSLLAWFALASLGVALSLRKFAPVTDASVLNLLQEVRLRRGVRREVRLKVSPSDWPGAQCARSSFCRTASPACPPNRGRTQSNMKSPISRASTF